MFLLYLPLKVLQVGENISTQRESHKFQQNYLVKHYLHFIRPSTRVSQVLQLILQCCKKCGETNPLRHLLLRIMIVCRVYTIFYVHVFSDIRIGYQRIQTFPNTKLIYDVAGFHTNKILRILSIPLHFCMANILSVKQISYMI